MMMMITVAEVPQFLNPELLLKGKQTLTTTKLTAPKVLCSLHFPVTLRRHHYGCCCYRRHHHHRCLGNHFLDSLSSLYRRADCENDGNGDGALRLSRKFSCAVAEKQTTAIAGAGTGEGKRALQPQDRGDPVPQ